MKLTDDLYYRKLESTSTTELVDMIREKDKSIAELEAQIEKMKCCGNCENRYGQEKCADCHNYNKWKFKQAEQFYEEIAD